MDQEHPQPAQPPAAAPPQRNNAMAILAYLSILVIIPYLVAKDDPFVKYHIKQGLVLLVIEVAVWLIGMFVPIYFVWVLLRLVNLATLVLAIVGIVNAAQGQERPLPIVGQYGNSFNI